MSSWFNRLKEGLKNSSSRLTEALHTIFIKKKLDQETLDELEELLILADMGLETSQKIVSHLKSKKFGQEVEFSELQDLLASHIEDLLAPYASPLHLEHHPHVILVVGVNGSGKTTTLGKLASHWKKEGKKVRLVAADTFRAAAVDQLKIWCDRVGVPLVYDPHTHDPASVAFEGVKQAMDLGEDVVMIDTAGRLQNKSNLMDELSKIRRVLGKLTGPHSVLLVLDGTVGQNAHMQLDVFKEVAGVTGLIVTKLDGTAKAGVVLSLALKHQLPIHAIGVGEQIDDLQPFTARAFARNLVGLNNE